MDKTSNSSRSVIFGEDDCLDKTNIKENGRTLANETLHRINESFHQSKADQILRLLKDQESLNIIFDTCVAPKTKEEIDEEGNKSDNSLSSDSMKETEKRLSFRLSLHKQRGGRSKTSMGFNKNNASSDEDDSEMSQPERQINTRLNRPKSSYVRRTPICTDYGENNEKTNDLRDGGGRTMVRPKSRLGCRGTDARHRRMALNEASSNRLQLDDDDGAQCVDDLIDVIDYDNYANTKYASNRHTGLKRQRSNLKLKGFCDNGASEMSVSNSNDFSAQIQDTNNLQNFSEQENVEDLVQSSTQRHRRQQLRSARGNRPTSENVFLVRQKTETGIVHGSSTNPNTRSRSDRLLLSASGSRNILSIDANPNQGSQIPKNYLVQESERGETVNPRERFKTYGAAPRQRPVSRRNTVRADIPGAIRGPGKNVAVYGARGPPISLMKLPPLDPAVAQRAERTLVIPPTRETCA